MRKFFYIALLVICSLNAKAQSIEDADAMFKQLMFMRVDAQSAKDSIYMKALECSYLYRNVLNVTPSGEDEYNKCKSVLTSLFPFLIAGAGHYSQEHNDSIAMLFAKGAISVAMMKEMQSEGLRKESNYPPLVYFAAARTYNAENYEDAVIYLKEYLDVTDVSKHSQILSFLKEAEEFVAQRIVTHENCNDVYEGVPDFDVFAKASIEKSINKWKEKDPYETIEEYKKRVNEDTAIKKQEELQNNLMKEYVQRFAKTITLQDIELKPYDAENQSFLIKTPYGDIVLSVPRKDDEAKDFAEYWNKVKVYNQNFYIANKRLALASLTFETPAGKIYNYNNQQSLTYNDTHVDANFKSIDYSFLSNSSGSETKVKIGKKKVVVGVSDVDVNIPKIKRVNEKTFAVIIANETYSIVPSVPMAGNDGRIFAQYCEETLGLPKENILQYPNATYGMMIRAIQDISNIAKAYNDIRIILYYAGHGIPNESTKDACLLPVDADGKEMAVCYPLKRLYRELSSLGAKNVVIFLDACFSGGTSDGGNLIASARGVAIKAKQETPQGNMIVFSAASDKETAFPYEEKGHGLFTYYLLKKLQESKGNTTLKELGDYISKNVREMSVVINRKLQTPSVICSNDILDNWESLKLIK